MKSEPKSDQTESAAKPPVEKLREDTSEKRTETFQGKGQEVKK